MAASEIFIEKKLETRKEHGEVTSGYDVPTG